MSPVSQTAHALLKGPHRAAASLSAAAVTGTSDHPIAPVCPL